MLNTTSDDIRKLQGSGKGFTELLDDVLRAQARSSGLPYNSIETDLQTNHPDGGVDTRVSCPIPGEPTGFLGLKTVWQYKSMETAAAVGKIKKEFEGKFLIDCLKAGHAYRYCICDSFTAERRAEINALLKAEVDKIATGLPAPLVVSADDVASWVSHFPALSLRYFHPGQAGSLFPFENWKKMVTAQTGQYVPLTNGEGLSRAIADYLDFSRIPTEMIFPVQGQAGVGKTRIVFESIAAIDGLRTLAIYTLNEQRAEELATLIATDDKMRAVLVADECTIRTRARLETIVRGCQSRLRVVAIDNQGRPSTGPAPEHWLKNLDAAGTESILEKNFSHISPEHRRAIAQISGGFVRIAADICNNYDKFVALGIGSTLATIEHYFDSRITEDLQRQHIEALSLVTKAGFAGDVSVELDKLCGVLSLDRATLQASANRLHDAPGFVGRGGRYYYVTPHGIARIAFARAWARWVAPDVNHFLANFPGELMQSFLDRVADCGTEEVQGLVATFFRTWAKELTPQDLAQLPVADKFIALTEASPAIYLPHLRALFERADPKQLLAITGGGAGGGRWASRRELVWLAERLAAFPDCLEDAEAILLRLALAESEPGIGNNATAIWAQLYRVFLSGTSRPFLERLKRLERYILSSDSLVSNMALDVLSNLLDSHHSRLSTPAIVGGRVAPEEWRPKTNSEVKTSYDAVVDLLGRLATSSDARLSQRSRDISAAHARWLIRGGYLPQLAAMLPAGSLPDNTRLQLIAGVETFLQFDADKMAEIAAAASKWLATLHPQDLHGRIVTAIGIEPWSRDMRGQEEIWKGEIKNIASHLLGHPEALAEELTWLLSPAAKSAAVLGEQIGLADPSGKVRAVLLDAVKADSNFLLLRGYVMGVKRASPKQLDQIAIWLDAIEDSQPLLAHNIAEAGGRELSALERTLRLVDSGKIPLDSLFQFFRGIDGNPLSLEEFRSILERFHNRLGIKDGGVGRSAVQFIAWCLPSRKSSGGIDYFEDAAVRELTWRILEVATEEGRGESYFWRDILEVLSRHDKLRCARIAIQALSGDSMSFQDDGEAILVRLAGELPDEIMELFGHALLDKKFGWKFRVGKHTTLLSAIRTESVLKWLGGMGVDGARALARHLPEPALREGEPEVPPLTEFVLETFEADDKVFNEFCAGTHSFQMYSGDIAAQHEAEAKVAARFLRHRLRRIREWAAIEIESSSKQAQWWRQDDEERFLE